MAERDVSPEEGDSVPFLGTLCGRDTLAGPRRPDLGAFQKGRGAGDVLMHPRSTTAAGHPRSTTAAGVRQWFLSSDQVRPSQSRGCWWGWGYARLVTPFPEPGGAQ